MGEEPTRKEEGFTWRRASRHEERETERHRERLAAPAQRIANRVATGEMDDVSALGVVEVTLGCMEDVRERARRVREHQVHVVGVGADGDLVSVRSHEHVGTGQTRRAEERQRQPNRDGEQAGELARARRRHGCRGSPQRRGLSSGPFRLAAAST